MFLFSQLKTWDFVELSQQESYGDIKVTPGVSTLPSHAQERYFLLSAKTFIFMFVFLYTFVFSSLRFCFLLPQEKESDTKK